jgi:tape measure domain-containing protein
MSTTVEELLAIPELTEFKEALDDAVKGVDTWVSEISRKVTIGVDIKGLVSLISEIRDLVAAGNALAASKASGAPGDAPALLALPPPSGHKAGSSLPPLRLPPPPPTNMERLISLWKSASAEVDGLTQRVIKGVERIGEVTKVQKLLSFWKDFGLSVAETSAKFEDLGLRLRFLEGSGEKGKAAMDWILGFADKVGQDPLIVGEAFIKMKEQGLDPTAESMMALVDSAAMAGAGQDGLVTMATTLGEAWANGSLELGTLGKLVEMGVPAFDLLAEASCTSKEEIEALAKAGKLGRSDITKLITAMGAHANGANAAYGQQYPMLLRRLTLAWEDFKRAVGDSGWMLWLKGRMVDVLDVIARLKKDGTFQFWANVVSKALETVGHILYAFARLALGTLDLLADGFKAAPGWVKVLVVALTALLLALSPITGPMLALYGAIALVGLILDDVFAFIDGRKSVLGEVVEGLKAWWRQLGPLGRMLTVFGATFGGLLASVMAWGVALKVLVSGFSLVTSALKGVSTAFGILSGVMRVAGAALAGLSWPVVGIVAAVAALAAVVYLVYANWSGIVAWFQGKIDAIKAAFEQGFLQGLVQIIKEFNLATLFKDLMFSLIGVFAGDEAKAEAEAWFQRNVTEPINQAIEKVKGLWKEFKDFLGIDDLMDKIDGIVPELPSVDGMIDGAGELLGNSFDSVTKFFGGGGDAPSPTTLAMANGGGGGGWGATQTNSFDQTIQVTVNGPANAQALGSTVASTAGQAVRDASRDLKGPTP